MVERAYSYPYGADDDGEAWEQYVDFEGGGQLEMTNTIAAETDNFVQHAPLLASGLAEFTFPYSTSMDASRYPPPYSDTSSISGLHSLDTSPVLVAQDQSSSVGQAQLADLALSVPNDALLELPLVQAPALDDISRSAPVAIQSKRSQGHSQSRRQRRRTLSGAINDGEGRFIHYRIHHGDSATSTSSGHNSWKKSGGRNGPLSKDTRKNAAIMRKFGSCERCRRKKTKCDSGIHCKHCIEHVSCELLRAPCRGQNLADLTDVVLPVTLGWHPHARSAEGVLASSSFNFSREATRVRVRMFFGPGIWLPVFEVLTGSNLAVHRHIVYPLLPNGQHDPPHTEDHTVLPIIIANTRGFHQLGGNLDRYLSWLLDDHFIAFPSFQLPWLLGIYELYINSDRPRLLRSALKLLIIVHTSGDTSVPLSDEYALHILRPASHKGPVTPCLIRGQLGGMLPVLARELLRDLLRELERECLTRRESGWSLVVATLLCLLITLESGQWKGARDGFHGLLDGKLFSHGPASQNPSFTSHDEIVDRLLAFYRYCYADVHARLLGPHPEPPKTHTFDTRTASWEPVVTGRKLIPRPATVSQPATSYLSAQLASARSNYNNIPSYSILPISTTPCFSPPGYTFARSQPHRDPSGSHSLLFRADEPWTHAASSSSTGGFSNTSFEFTPPAPRMRSTSDLSNFPTDFNYTLTPPQYTSNPAIPSTSSFGPFSAALPAATPRSLPPHNGTSSHSSIYPPSAASSFSNTTSPPSAADQHARAQAKFIETLRQTIANSRAELLRKRDMEVHKGMGDGNAFFGRLVARLVVGSC